jgi:hypothetical protein
MTPAVKWTNDCCGKKDYDGPIISVSTRYWPATGGFLILDHGEFVDPPPGKPSANASIILNHGAPDENGEADYYTLREINIEDETETAVRSRVEAWVQEQFDDIVRLLGVPQ